MNQLKLLAAAVAFAGLLNVSCGDDKTDETSSTTCCCDNGAGSEIRYQNKARSQCTSCLSEEASTACEG